MQEVKEYLWSFENRFNEMEYWTIKVAKITDSLFHGMGMEPSRGYKINWFVINLETYEEAAGAVQRAIERDVKP